MKISKYAALIKKTRFAIVAHMPDGIYLGTGASIYKAEGIPDMSGREQIGAVLDIEPKKLKKIKIEERRSLEKSNIWGLNLEDTPAASEQDAERLETVAVIDGDCWAALAYDAGKMLFFDESLLSPLADRLNNEDRKPYIRYAVRYRSDGSRYIVIKDGLETLGAILPVKVLTAGYIDKLWEFCNMCENQFRREDLEQPALEITENIQEEIEENNE
ncbi:MAG: hypothetical protein HDR02_15120 [Lachnospiraceae bacterium]|nr:hypothetical protein [Lachnospiraceae bacterium]